MEPGRLYLVRRLLRVLELDLIRVIGATKSLRSRKLSSPIGLLYACIRHMGTVAIQAAILVHILWCVTTAACPQDPIGDAGEICSPAATRGDQLYFETEAFAPIRSSLLQLRRRIYELKKFRIEELMLQDLLRLESQRTGESQEKILKKAVTDSSRVEEEEIDAYIDDNLDVSWWKRFWIRPRIRGLLRERKLKDRRKSLFRKLLVQHQGTTTYTFSPPPPYFLRASSELPRPFLGNTFNPLAILTVFSDYLCEQCNGLTRILKKLVKHYRGRVVVYFHNFPLSEAAASIDAAIAGDMAFRKGRYLQMHSVLYQNQSNLTRDQIIHLGTQCRLDPEELAAALSNKANRRRVSKDYHSGRLAGIAWTPTILIGGRAIPGRRDLATYTRLVEELIQDRLLTMTKSLPSHGGID